MSRPFQTLSEKEMAMEMEGLVKEGRDAGMDQAQIITTDKVVVDDRVSYKCMFSCSGYNTNLQCPPFSMKPAETRELLQKYSYGIIYRKRVSQNIFAAWRPTKVISGPRYLANCSKQWPISKRAPFIKAFILPWRSGEGGADYAP